MQYPEGQRHHKAHFASCGR
uniref:Aquaporin 2 n=1 Tax=Rhizophora mucronata TaxID=61149 RepID=A0A2P2PIM9_RHIMU